MPISAKAEYACHALIALAQHEERPAPLTREDIARLAGVPVSLLHSIFQRLRVAGLVEIHRGWGGGYRLAVPPERISLAEVLKAVDGPPRPLRKSDQPLAHAMARAFDLAWTTLSETSIAQVAKESVNPAVAN